MSWRGIIVCCCRAIRRLLAILLLIALMLYFYLSYWGIPRHFVDQWLGKLGSAGYIVTVERIRLDLMEGIVAEHFRAFEDTNQTLPMLEADRVALQLNPFDWLKHTAGLRRLQIHNGFLRLSLADQPVFEATDALILRNVDGMLRFGSDAWNLQEFSADFLGIKISCRGKIRIPQATVPADQRSEGRGQRAEGQQKSEPQRPEDRGQRSETRGQSSEVRDERSEISNQQSTSAGHETTVTHQLNALTRSQRERILELVNQLNAITFSIPPHADIIFQIDPDHPARNEATISMEGAATRAFAMRFDQWRFQATLKDGRVSITEARIQQRGQYLTCSGSYSFTNQMADAHLRGSVVLKDWLIRAPPAWREAMARTGCSIEGPIQCDIHLDPTTVDQALYHLHGQLALMQADLKGIWIERGGADFAIEGDLIQVDPFYFVLGRGTQQGPIQGHLLYDMNTGDYEGHAEANFDPHVLASVLNSNQAEFATAFVFKDKPIAIEADVSGQASRDDSLWMAGGIQASNFTYNAVPVTSVQFQFGYAGGILSFTDLRLARPEGEVTGRFSDVVDGTVLELDLVSTVDPKAIARLIGYDLVSYLDGFHFAGPMRIAARGHIDYGSGALTDIQAGLDGAHWGYAPLHADRCSLNVAVQQFRFDLTDIRGEAYEGTFSGKASFYPFGADTNFWYDLYAKADDVNLNTLLQSLGYKGKEEYEGHIYTECALGGAIGQGRGNTAKGGGWIRIQDGQLFQLHLLGGFSRMVSIIYPDLGTISLTDFGANFTVKDRQLDTRDAIMSGPTLAIHGEGYYAFDENLNFIVWAEAPEHKMLLPRLTKAIAPIFSKLLAVRLTGTVSDPKWWPLNLTKDQLLALPKDILVTMPKDVLIGLPKDLLVTLPKEVLVTLPHELLITLPKEILIDLPEEVFIKLPQEIWNKMNRPRPKSQK